MKTVIIYLIFSVFSFSINEVDKMQEKVKKIDTEIIQKKERIEDINSEKEKIEKQITEIKKEIEVVVGERKKIESEIKKVEKNIDYGERNLKFTSKELTRKKAEFDAKIIAWNRRKNTNLSFEEESILKRQFSKILYDDLNRMRKIKTVSKDIKIVKLDIETERVKLGSLRYDLRKKITEIEKKENQKSFLISKLEKEKKKHISKISSLEKEKIRIEKEIGRIISSKVKHTGTVKYSTAVSSLGKSIYPIENGRIIVNFGELKEKTVASNGIEILGNLGSVVKSALSGTIIYVGKIQGLGKVIMVDYGYNTIGVYGNIIGAKVKVKQEVEKGEIIGILGLSTSGKPVLYYEVRLNLKPINPRGLF